MQSFPLRVRLELASIAEPLSAFKVHVPQIFASHPAYPACQAKSVAVPVQSSPFVFERLTFASQSLASAKLKGGVKLESERASEIV